MCGIIGYVASHAAMNDEKTKSKVFKIATALLVAAQERGTHATGYAAIKRAHGGELVIEKAAGPATEFVRKRKWFSVRALAPNVLIGHTRHTTGTVPTRMLNNHPFLGNEKPWTMVHNGWLTNDDEARARLLKDGVRFDSKTDSEVILRSAEQYATPVDGAIATLGSLTGPQAIALGTFEEAKLPKVFLWTNGGNPLWIGTVHALPGVMFFASTEIIMGTAIGAVLGKVALKRWNAEKIKSGRIVSLEPLRKRVRIVDHAELPPTDIAHVPTKRATVYPYSWTPTGNKCVSRLTREALAARWKDSKYWNGVSGITDAFGHAETSYESRVSDWESFDYSERNRRRAQEEKPFEPVAQISMFDDGSRASGFRVLADGRIVDDLDADALFDDGEDDAHDPTKPSPDPDELKTKRVAERATGKSLRKAKKEVSR